MHNICKVRGSNFGHQKKLTSLKGLIEYYKILNFKDFIFFLGTNFKDFIEKLVIL